VRRPVPIRTAAGRDARATQLVALARRHRIPIHRDSSLAISLAEADGAVPEAHWPRLAEIIAAVRRS
jgi:flagellar biosynthesis protein FlhB